MSAMIRFPAVLWAALNVQSGNAKTGPIATRETTSNTCPPTCGMRDACYAKAWPAVKHWEALDTGQRGVAWQEFLARLLLLPAGSLCRGNQWGDQPGDGATIDVPAFRALVAHVGHLICWSYTHYPLTFANVRELRSAVALGYVVNASADHIAQADEKAATGLPTVVALPHAAGCPARTDTAALCTCARTEQTPAGRKIVVCSAQTKADVTCKTCGGGTPLCARAERPYLVGFRVHGFARRRAERIALNVVQ